jgi:phosphatidate cytidylyltransferase
MFALIGTASCDIFSFLAGRTLGRHQLAPSISPKKTIEGALGGWVFSVIACFFLGQLFQVQIWHSIVLGGIIGIAAITGDLAESLIKRSAGVKDAGTWIPEQGGLLDVIDGLLFVLVAVYYYGALIMRVAG